MKRAIVLLFALRSTPAHAEPLLVHASATCAPSNKPGRIRCRAVLELPLDRATSTRIGWAEVRITSAHASITPLRGRLGVLDAESRDDARVVWSFSVAAASVGEFPMDVRLLATLEPNGGPPTLADQRLTVPVRVTPDK